MSAPTHDARPTRAHFEIGQRLMRGYGPLAVFALMLLLMSVLVPSKVPDESAVSSGSSSGTDGSGAEGPETVVTTPEGAQAEGGAGGAGGEAGGGATAPGSAGGCPDRKEQVPGDPYSPPCTTFKGDNGGDTSKGVDAKTIKVAYRVLNEKGFQQTLAQLAGASLSDTPDSVTRTVGAGLQEPLGDGAVDVRDRPPPPVRPRGKKRGASGPVDAPAGARATRATPGSCN
jgi:hypothetical protein